MGAMARHRIPLTWTYGDHCQTWSRLSTIGPTHRIETPNTQSQRKLQNGWVPSYYYPTQHKSFASCFTIAFWWRHMGVRAPKVTSHTWLCLTVCSDHLWWESTVSWLIPLTKTHWCEMCVRVMTSSWDKRLATVWHRFNKKKLSVCLFFSRTKTQPHPEMQDYI